MFAKQRGFTIIELMLALAFVGILLIAIAMAVIQVTHIYTKGMTIKGVNQSGRDIIDSIRRDAQSSSPGSVVLVAPAAGGGLGRLCLGTETYLWNTPTSLQNGTAVSFSDTHAAIVLARVDDIGGAYCVKSGGAYSTTVLASNASVLLASKDNDLALYDIQLTDILAASTPGVLYSLSFTIGTNESGTVNTLDQSCKPPTDDTSNFNFCSINNFETVIRVG